MQTTPGPAPASRTYSLSPSGIIGRVDVDDVERIVRVDLDHGLFLGPREMMMLRRHHDERAGRKSKALVAIQLVAHARIQRTCQHSDDLIGGMPVCSDRIV